MTGDCCVFNFLRRSVESKRRFQVFPKKLWRKKGVAEILSKVVEFETENFESHKARLADRITLLSAHSLPLREVNN